MEVGFAFFVVVALILVIWIFIEIKRMRHKLFAIFLIALILFTYISFSVVLRGKNIDYTSVSGWTTAGKLYFSWLGNAFENFKTLTSSAVKMDWEGNKSLSKD